MSSHITMSGLGEKISKFREKSRLRENEKRLKMKIKQTERDVKQLRHLVLNEINKKRLHNIITFTISHVFCDYAREIILRQIIDEFKGRAIIYKMMYDSADWYKIEEITAKFDRYPTYKILEIFYCD